MRRILLTLPSVVETVVLYSVQLSRSAPTALATPLVPLVSTYAASTPEELSLRVMFSSIGRTNSPTI